ncbi:hypothetical protein ACO0LM_22200 [Undibacterium sp. Di26W]|uniref:hypothetical protein n=1 Tax=Undibacterium sp. Di26W TaxID=3413035 RepID=UPI003BF304F7
MTRTAIEIYVSLMTTIRNRLDLIDTINNTEGNDFSRAETAAFHGRKVVEGIAFGCLVSIGNSIKNIPRDAKGQWNAEIILKSLKSKNITSFPSPSLIRKPTAIEQKNENVAAVVEGIPERRISPDDLISIYKSMHPWLHEINPYTEPDRDNFYAKNGKSLWGNMNRLNQFIEKHFIAISGEGFFCILRDDEDDTTKVVSLSRPGP